LIYYYKLMCYLVITIYVVTSLRIKSRKMKRSCSGQYIINKLWHIAARTDSRIEPIPCGQQQWQDNKSDAVLEIARNEGVTVAG
jgi:hypothetical protein